MRHFRLLFAFLSLMVLFFPGCTPTRKVVMMEHLRKSGAPTWVIRGSGVYEEAGTRVFYGVASASGMTNYTLLRAAAENRARNEVAKLIRFTTSSLMKDYVASNTSSSGSYGNEEGMIERVVKTVSSMTLIKVEIVDHWQDPESGEFFALARLDMETYMENLNRAEGLNVEAREYIRKNAERILNEEGGTE